MSETPAETPAPKAKGYSIITKEKSYTAVANTIAWTENGQFILLMEGDSPKHVIVAANVIAVTEA